MSETISHYIKNINDSILLPGIQRRFRWGEDGVRSLFNSVLNDFPIGSIIKYRSDRMEDSYVAYRFITNYIDEDERVPKEIEEYYESFCRENQMLTDGESELRSGGEFTLENQKHTLIIDGQQRLTALNIGYNGAFLDYHAGGGYSKDDSENWEKRYLCLNVLADDSRDDESPSPIDNVFQFRSEQDLETIPLDGDNACLANLKLTKNTQQFWVAIPTVTEVGRTALQNGVKTGLKKSRNKFEDYSGAFSDDVKSTIGDRIDDFKGISEYELEDESWDNSYKLVPEIFSRINIEGETLSAEDLLMSEFMKEWSGDSDITEERIPRRLIDKFVKDIQRHERAGFEEEVDWELLLTAICNKNGHKLTQSHAKDPELEKMKGILYGDDPTGDGPIEFKRAVQKPLIHLNDMGLDDDVVPKKLLAALSVYYLEIERDDSLEIEPRENKNNIFQFIAATLLLNSIDSDVMRRSKPFDAISELNEDKLRQRHFPSEEAIKNIGGVPSEEDLLEMMDGKRYDANGEIGKSASGILAILGLLNWKDDIDGSQIDHIYPESKAEDFGVETEQLHRIGNLQILEKDENNRVKDDQTPDEWLSAKAEVEAAEYAKKNIYLGEDVDDSDEFSGWETDLSSREEECIEFINSREKLMAKKIRELFNISEGEDSEETDG